MGFTWSCFSPGRGAGGQNTGFLSFVTLLSMETNVLWASWVITQWADIKGQILSKNHLGCVEAQFDY